MKTQLNIFTKAAISVIFVGLFQAITISATLAATIASSASGDWSNTSTWVGGVVPGAGDDVIIAEGHNIQLATSRTVSSLTIAVTTMNTTFDLNTNGELNISNNLSLISNEEFVEIRMNINDRLVINGDLYFSSVATTDTRINMYSGANVTYME